uniref:Clade I nitrous oxide reductase n=1 Tax=Steinernema glaseri TaxID=37863 RepID=A0A1I7XX28_9BILA
QTDEDERQHIGGDGEGQHQCPVEPASAGEFAQAGEPGQAHAQHGDADAHAEDQGQGVAQQAAHLGVEQVRPDLQVDALPRQH